MNLHSHKAVGTGSARALACIGRRLAGRTRRSHGVFGGAPNTTREGACAPRRNNAVALVITLLMLSVITFLTIAFLALSQRNQSAVSATLDQANARAASEAALARAQTEIVAQMLAHGDALYYDYMVSRNYVSPSNFDVNENAYDPNNVNYDSFRTNNLSSANYAQMIANLWYDPRPPVFVITNQALPNNYDFRFWVDINRNGRFETNGYQPTVYDNGLPTGYYGYYNGEPEFIGVLKNPLYPPSSSNQFVSRYAYLVLPIGKELDINYIHNFLKGTYGLDGNLTNTSRIGTTENDGFARDQGVGSWELNLAGVLDNVSPWAYESNASSYITGFSPYDYLPPNPALNNGQPNKGNAFDDAEAILHYRYPPASVYPFLAPLGYVFSNYLDFNNNYIDMYCQAAPLTAPFNYSGTNTFPTPSPVKWPWPGSYQTNVFFDVQDLFDPNKTSPYFTNRMIQASLRTNTYDRYTFQRLLSCIGMGSSPEYSVWVHADNGGLVQRTKVNLNYDNTAQINAPNAPYVPMPTNLIPWTALGFFTNAAELLLRSQSFGFTNYITNNGALVLTTLITNFGVTEIPVYRTNALGIHYDPSVHRMLQLAANIYDATVGSNYPANLGKTGYPPPVRHPSVFRPLFGLAYSNNIPDGINIIGYAQVTNAAIAYNQMYGNRFYDLSTAMTGLVSGTLNSNVNIWGVPWVVGANYGLPQFYQYSYQSSVLFERKVLFARYPNAEGMPDTNRPPHFTNQFYCMGISNNFGMDAWNPYPSNFTGSQIAGNGTTWYYSNYITVEFTNNYNYGVVTNITNFFSPITNLNQYTWTGWQKGLNDTNGFITFFQTNYNTVAPCYFSEAYKQLVYFTNGIIASNAFLAADTNQSSWPVHNWTLNITNHVVYALFDGPPATGALLDFVNLGPFGSSVNIQQYLNQNNATGNPGGILGTTGGGANNYWGLGNGSDIGASMSTGLLNQITTSEQQNTTFLNNVNGKQPSTAGSIFGAAYEPSNILLQLPTWVANDPLVHYTVDDLVLTNSTLPQNVNIPPFPPLTNNLGKVNTERYAPWGAGDIIGNNMLFKDPQMTNASAWSFPTNKFPGVGWLGRVHRGTPWQTVYLKADNPAATTSGTALGSSWVTWANSPWYQGEPFPETYPTNDWTLVDLFTAAPNDNAARGLLSVNQTNDAAWAAVFAGVIAPTNTTNGSQIMPINDVSNLVDANSTYGGINALRTNYANGIFHKVGDILAAPALTTQSPFLTTNGITPASCTDEIIERIPQQTLSLLKVGEPQFVIFAWGQALKPKGPPYLTLLPGGANNNIVTNYEITGEVLTRTVCHLVHTNGVKMVVDSFNVESGSGN
jgi:hypothetical protein